MKLSHWGSTLVLACAAGATIGCSEGSKTPPEPRPKSPGTLNLESLKPLSQTKSSDLGALNPKGSVSLGLKNFPVKLEVNTDWELSVVVGGTVGGIDIDSSTPILKFSAKDCSFTLIPLDSQFNWGAPLNKNFKRTYSNGELGYELGAKFQATRWVVVEFKAGVTTSPKPVSFNTLNFTSSTFENGKLTFSPILSDWKTSELSRDFGKPAPGRSPFVLANPSKDLELGKWMADFDAKWNSGEMKLKPPTEAMPPITPGK